MRKVLNLATFGLLGGSLLNSKKTPAPAPTPATPAVMPTPDDEAIRAARRRSIVQQLSRGGRSSTILTGDKLGS
jgi:hypothetical protein